MAFPIRYQGTISLITGKVSKSPPPPPEVVVDPRSDPIRHGGILAWTVTSGDDSYNIYADYKGRGFWIVDGRNGSDLSGPVHAEWKNSDHVIGAVAAIEAIAKRRQRLQDQM